MTFVWQDLIDRARTYVDDDHKEDNGWLGDARWLDLGNVEYRSLYAKWCRNGLITPGFTQVAMTGNTHGLTAALAIIGVAEDLGSNMRVLEPAQQSDYAAYWRGSTASTGVATSWAARGLLGAGTIVVELDPYVTNPSKYFIRYIPTPTAAGFVTDTVDLPFEGDERLVLGMARRALIKESSRSQEMDKQIFDIDASMNMTAFGRLSPKVRRTDKRTPNMFYAEPGRWIFFV